MTKRKQIQESLKGIAYRRRILMVILIMGILTSVFCISSYVSAYDEQEGTCNADYVRVRSGAGTSYSLKTYDGSTVYLYDGDEVTVIGEADDSSGDLWYKVTFDYGSSTITGYVYGDYITISDSDSDYEYDEDFEEYLDEQGFPDSYKDYLRELHEEYPNWVFVADFIDEDWSTVVEAESVVGRNLVSTSALTSWKSTETGAYDWETDTYTILDGSSWVSASEDIIAYYLDPRNFLDETSIFMFETLSYNSSTQTISGVKTIVDGTFMDYSNSVEGTTYPNIIMKAAKASGVSPFYLASSIIQEQGTDGTSSLISGTYSGYEGYYNFFNYGASGSTTKAVIVNGLKYAKTQGWTSRLLSIKGGAVLFGSGYISIGQDTLYYKKFDLVGTYYTHQYMTNVGAAASEASTMASAYTDDMKESMTITFTIPVYDNMPSTAVSKPTSDENVNNYLSSLSVNGYSLTPTFDASTKSYSLTVDNSVTSVKVVAEAVASESTVSGTGKVSLSVGTNTVKVVVTSESGDKRTYKITIIRQEADDDDTDSSEDASVETNYTITTQSSSKIITGIEPGTYISEVKSEFTLTNCTIKFFDTDGDIVTSGKIGTGYKIKIYDSSGSVTATYNVVIYGDVNGDGEINTSDVLAMRRDLFGYVELSGVYATAADVNKDGSSATTSDILAVRRDIFGYVSISQD